LFRQARAHKLRLMQYLALHALSPSERLVFETKSVASDRHGVGSSVPSTPIRDSSVGRDAHSASRPSALGSLLH
jgi:hypothetical protein